jgi:hypothetical protein
MNCKDCGIGTYDGEKIYCMCFSQQKELESDDNCSYFINKRYEDGELMTPLIHLLFKEEEIKSRGMTGINGIYHITL